MLIDIRNNPIEKLPPSLFTLNLDYHIDKHDLMSLNIHFDNNGSINFYYNSKKGIYIDSNIKSPPLEIIRQGKMRMKTYFKSAKNSKRNINEVKVILVGEGGSGKTSLMKKIFNKNFNLAEPQTHGINRESRTIIHDNKTIKINLWDFGGQEIMHATHQFFLSKRSLYLLVVDARREEKTEYWLQHIRCFGGDSPTLVIINKIDENPGYEENRKNLKNKYPFIKEFHRLSCATGENVNDFIESFYKYVSQVEHIETEWPESWFNVKSKLEDMNKNEKEWISYDDFIDICKNEDIIEEEVQEALVEFLNDLGCVIHFNERLLRDTNVINPAWITKAVYDIINSRELADNKGILSISSLKNILDKKNYNHKRERFIIELMNKFELSFSLDKEMNGILIPDLLSKEEPEFDFKYSTALKFIIQFTFLPRAIIPRFIVKMKEYIKEIKTNEGEIIKLIWRTGAVLEDMESGCIGVIRADNEKKIIDIYINGKEKENFLYFFRKTFIKIINGYNNTGYKEIIQCICNHCKGIRDPYLFEYKSLKDLIKLKEDKIQCHKSGEMLIIQDLLNGVGSYDDNKISFTGDKVTVEMKQLICKKFSEENDFDNLCRALEIESNLFQGNFDVRITSLLKYIDRNKNKQVEILKEAILKLKPYLKDLID